MNVERDMYLKRPYTPGLDHGLRGWLQMRRELADARAAGDTEHIIRSTKYKYRTYWNCQIHEQLCEDTALRDTYGDIIAKISDTLTIDPEHVRRLTTVLTTKNYPEDMSPIDFPIRAERNTKLAFLQDEMKCVLCQTHEQTLVLKLDFYWVDVDLIIDRKSVQTMLHFACFNGDLKKVAVLLERGASVNARDFKGQTPFMLSLNSPKLIHPYQLIKLLIDNGADVGLPDNRGFTPLHRACLLDEMKIIEIILQRKAAVNVRDNKDRFAIQYSKVKVTPHDKSSKTSLRYTCI